eukprot:CAMPEP_0194362838 /NCGR_PEP_ID=MMETSP0174-20130528/10693_1 /TAXON_ID=216777 /ORGANISM="Proboscia alata, Strain PI-D3" /LENGTH=455 /DNA_ID=CAMNT_0039136005 /DNA_START=100 /DNA_END=1467 /DNA_ORIENTATION=+
MGSSTSKPAESSQQQPPQPVSACPVQHETPKTSSEIPDGCPVKHSGQPQQPVQYNVYSQPIDPNNQAPIGIANQLPSPQQKEHLSAKREPSSIQKGGTDNSTWTYPSPQQFYNALARKNKLGDTTEDEIETVVALHNNMNEGTWEKLLEWEELQYPSTENVKNMVRTQTKLLKFMGRPSDLSPKAAFKHYILGHPLPFDRHDWTIIRPDGTQITYVIDYYHDESRASTSDWEELPDKSDREAVKSILVDVRPCVFALENIWQRGVTMPLSRRGFSSQESKFEPLPLFPTRELKDQVEESEETWQNIQAAAEATQKELQLGAINSNATVSAESPTVPEPVPEPQISDREAIALARAFAATLKECAPIQKEMILSCNKADDGECAQASLALTMCMGKNLCKVQHEAVGSCVNDAAGGEEIQNAKIDAALENLAMCVGMTHERVDIAQRQHPDVFADN